MCGAIVWDAVSAGDNAAGSVWRTAITLADIPEQHIIVPSFACLTSAINISGFCAAKHPANLRPHTRDTCRHRTLAGFVSPTPNAKHMLSKIDCWHTAVDCADVQAELDSLPAASINPPANDLLTLSIRPIDRDARTIALPAKAVTRNHPARSAKCWHAPRLQNASVRPPLPQWQWAVQTRQHCGPTR